MEYPGYGVYEKDKSDKTMEEDAVRMFDFLVDTIGFDPGNILVFGRSIGTGPATYLASKRPKCKLLLLVSPFMSLRSAVKDMASVFSFFVRERFPNLKRMGDVKCPLLIIHGEKDKVINVKHSRELFKRCTAKYKKLKTPENMDHNKYRLYDDLIIPAVQFLKVIKLNKVYLNKREQRKASSERDTDRGLRIDDKEEILPVIKNLKEFKSDRVYELENAGYDHLDSDEEKPNISVNNSRLQRAPEQDRIVLTQSSVRKKEIIKLRKNRFDLGKPNLEKKIDIFGKKPIPEKEEIGGRESHFKLENGFRVYKSW